MRQMLTRLACCAFLAVASAGEPGYIAVCEIKGAIGPATAAFVARAIQLAADQRAECLVIEMDTPGGLLDSTKEIVQSIYSSPVPVVVYVTPAGAVAGSAGCFITLAADVAAMAPNTSIGAAHPVALGGFGGEKLDDVMKQKLENFAASYIESIAMKRGRNVEWARSAVKESTSITAEKALEMKVIEVLARDLTDLAKQLEGREHGGHVLRTAGAKVTPISMTTREKLFQALCRPEVMFILMLIAVYGIIGELSNPGAILPGVAGAIALILSLYLASVLPVRTAGLALLLVALALFIVDIFATSHGVLTVGGVVAFVLGALMLFDRSEPAFRLSVTLIVASAALTAGFFIFVLGAGVRAQFLPVRAGREVMLGKAVTALAPIDQQTGKVWIEGEYWNAVSDTPVARGEIVEVVGVQGLTLRVKPKPQDK